MYSNRLPDLERLVLILVLGAISFLCWISLLFGHGWRHHSSPGFLWSVLFVSFCLWLVMQVAMMLPAVLPWILALSSIQSERRQKISCSVFFLLGYFLVWSWFSLVAALAQQVLLSWSWLGGEGLELKTAGAGFLFIGAALFQVSPLKATCLKHCRNPLSFLLTQNGNRLAGRVKNEWWATWVGLRHGLYCLVCCWALMSLCFALGLMHLFWMAAITAWICLEKLSPWGQQLSRLSALPMGLWGLLLLFGSGE